MATKGKLWKTMEIHRNQCSGLCQTIDLVYKTIALAAMATPTPIVALILQPTLRLAESSRTHVRSTFECIYSKSMPKRWAEGIFNVLNQS